MIVYFTYNDIPSGLYTSQVIDTVLFYQKHLKTPVKLVALISLRNFFNNRVNIKKALPDAVVMPMVPGIGRWRLNIPVMRGVFFLLKPKIIIGRSVLATQISLRSTKSRIVYDGRGAISAEWKEYDVVNDATLKSEASRLEQECIRKSSFRIAVSNKLVEYWRNEYKYESNYHVVIPCTLSLRAEHQEVSLLKIAEARKKLGYLEEDVICVYSGSVAGWQSFGLVQKFIENAINLTPEIKFLFLSPPSDTIKAIIQDFPKNVIQKHVQAHEVPGVLLACDYGILIREESLTNMVASPIKFAEYLSCGLKVIISPNLGDYSDFVRVNRCGYIYPEVPILAPLKISEKQMLHSLGQEHFSKYSYFSEFKTIITNNF